VGPDGSSDPTAEVWGAGPRRAVGSAGGRPPPVGQQEGTADRDERQARGEGPEADGGAGPRQRAAGRRPSTGWDCGPIEDGDELGNPYFFDGSGPVTCRYAYEPGQAVTPLQLVLESADAPTGTVTVVGTGNADPNAVNDHRVY